MMKVAIIIVSHSRELAVNLCGLARQGAADARLFAVGGVGEAGKEFGTDAVALMETIVEADSPAGTLILLDMGSALLSAETALSLLDPEVAARCRLCSAPLVEGCVSAAVQASVGMSLEHVAREASLSLQAKQQQLGEVSELSEAGSQVIIPTDALCSTMVVNTQHGLHARPAAALVRQVAGREAKVYLQKNNTPPVAADSLNSVAQLNVRCGEEIRIFAWGEQAAEVLADLEELISSGFGEEQTAAVVVSEALLAVTETTSLVEISSGIGIGQVWSPNSVVTPTFPAATVPEEQLERLLVLIDQAQHSLQLEIGQQGESEASKNILQVHQLLLQDPELRRQANILISQNHCSAAEAWYRVCIQQAEKYRALKTNPYLQERGADLKDVAYRLLREENEMQWPSGSAMPDDAVLFVDELVLGDLTQPGCRRRLRAIVSCGSGKNSHAAIIARSWGIPMLGGYRPTSEMAFKTVIVDASSRQVLVDPDKETLNSYRQRIQQAAVLRRQLCRQEAEAAVTLDGHHVECWANIGDVNDIKQLDNHVIEGVGLFRSEFLFLGRSAPPSEEEQYQLYRQALESLPGKTVVVRLLDVGADKPLNYLDLPAESNPALGLRGIRLCLRYRELLRCQLRALLRASEHGHLAIMVPMIVDACELEEVRVELADCRQQLGLSAARVSLGVMIETPASIFLAKQLLSLVDFVSVGSNDLSQYVLAAQRDGGVSTSDAAHPAVLAALAQLCQQAAPVPVRVCGEAAADRWLIPLLLGLGINRLSVNLSSLSTVKYLVRRLNFQDCQQLSNEAQRCQNAEQVRRLVAQRLPWLTELALL